MQPFFVNCSVQQPNDFIKMKLFVTTILALTVSIQAFSQQLLAQAKSGDNWGYIDKTGAFVIEPQYKNCHAFAANGLAPIYDKKEKTFYFIKPDGSKLKTSEPKFKLQNVFGFGTLGFTDGMAPIQVDKKWGYMHESGKVSVPARFDKVRPFGDGLGVAKIGDSFIIIESNGTERELNIPGLQDVRKFTDGAAPFKANDKWGFIDIYGKVISEAKFKGIGYLRNGLAWAKTEDGKVGFINIKGQTQIEFIYTAAKDFTDGMARVKKGENWIYVDAEGKELMPSVSAEKYGKFSDGLAYAKKAGKVGFIAKNGDWGIKPAYDKVRDFKNGIAAVRDGELWGFIDTKGEWVIEPKFDTVKDFEKLNK